MGKSNFEKLRVYELAEALTDHIWNIVLQWDKFEKDTIGKQLVRAADSIGANIAEGAGRRGYQDNKRFIYIARGSIYETKFWLRRAYKRGLLSDAHTADIKPLLDELAPKLNAYINSIGRETGAKQPSINNNQPT
jgi:four helix bundle protein